MCSREKDKKGGDGGNPEEYYIEELGYRYFILDWLAFQASYRGDLQQYTCPWMKVPWVFWQKNWQLIFDGSKTAEASTLLE